MAVYKPSRWAGLAVYSCRLQGKELKAEQAVREKEVPCELGIKSDPYRRNVATVALRGFRMSCSWRANTLLSSYFFCI